MTSTHGSMRTLCAALALLLTAGCSSSSSQDNPAGSGKPEGSGAAATPGAPKPGAKAGPTASAAAAKPGASAGTTASAAAPAQPGGDVKGSEPAGGDKVAPSELEFVEMKVVVDKAAGNAKEDTFNYFKLWGELKNKSSKWVDDISGDIRYFDASGKELGIDSIGTAVKEDLGDKSPGEPVSSDVKFIAPGATVPMHHIRSLNKIGGTYASYKITLRPARAVTKYPEGALEGMEDKVANVPDETLPSSTPANRRVVTGTIRNKGTMGCRKPELVVGFYDTNGKLADLSTGTANDDIKLVVAPGATAPVKVFTLVEFDNAWKAKATIKTWVSCSEPYD